MAEIVTMPKLGFDMAEGVLIRWVVGEGDSVSKGQLLAEIETDKATVEVESPYDGIVFKHLVSEDSIVPINDPIAVVAEEGEDVNVDELVGGAQEDEEGAQEPEAEESTKEPERKAPQKAEEGAHLPDGVRASPLARNMAEEHDINLKNLKGSGPKGRIVKKDIEAHLESGPERDEKGLGAAPKAVAPTREDTTVGLTRLRQAIGRRMTESKQWYPHFYVTYDYNMDEVMKVRKQANEMLAESGVKLSVNDFIMKAVALALREFPNLNASLGDGEIVRHGHINVSAAVAVEGGLLTVVCKDTDTKSLTQISEEVKEMAGRAREGKIRTEDVDSSTFTTSNLGMYGVDDFTAIINPPEAAILAIGGAKKIPVVENGEIKVGWRMKATISADHRVTDGAEAADFMRTLAKYLEQPLRLMV